MTDTLHQEPERDQFKSESPIRAFTDWQVNGRYALGKGFRPSLQHVVPYLEAMERKEGWRVVQVLEAGTQTPSFLFRLEREPTLAELRERYPHLDFALPEEEPYVHNREGFEEAGRKIDQARDMAAPLDEPLGTPYDLTPPAEAIGGQPPISAIGDDPVNPKHYGGTACAEIGELLTANSYQVLKYNWRLGEKDEPCQEIDKSLWYLDREIALIAEGHTFIPGDHRLPDHTFFDRRLDGRSEHTKEVARKLISWNRYGKIETLKLLRKLLQDKRSTFTCDDIGRGLAI